jgi:hypothetical protein
MATPDSASVAGVISTTCLAAPFALSAYEGEALATLIPCGYCIYGLVTDFWLLTLFSRLRSLIPRTSSGFRGRQDGWQ